jgi:hypothetical protein
MIDENTDIGAIHGPVCGHTITPKNIDFPYRSILLGHESLVAERDALKAELASLRTRYDAIKGVATRAVDRWTDGDTGGIADLAQTLTEVEGE